MTVTVATSIHYSKLVDQKAKWGDISELKDRTSQHMKKAKWGDISELKDRTSQHMKKAKWGDISELKDRTSQHMKRENLVKKLNC